jgi:hypothetical protein
MQKIIMIIIATIVNETVAAQDQSKVLNECTLNTVHQCCKANSVEAEMVMETSMFEKKANQPPSVDLLLPWNLFANFKLDSPITVKTRMERSEQGVYVGGDN